MKRGSKKEVTCFYLEKDKKRAARVAAAQDDLGLSDFLRAAVDEKLKRDTSFFGEDAQDDTHYAHGNNHQ
jgi:hypothetical protein